MEPSSDHLCDGNVWMRCYVFFNQLEEESTICFAVWNKKKEDEQKMREREKQNERLATGVKRLSHQTLFLVP